MATNICQSDLIRSGPPSRYRLTPHTVNAVTRVIIGEKHVNQTNRTILLVGETGAGKAALIDALVNFFMGGRWEDDSCFHIAQTEASDVVVYHIWGTLPFSLTVIDTPGYGEASGGGRDAAISQRLLDLFSSQDGVHEMNAVGLVLKASENRLSDRLQSMLDSTMCLFGGSMVPNTVALFTHSDGQTPTNALEALEAANVKCARNEENQPVHFLFGNRQDEDRITTQGMRQLKTFLEKAEPQSVETLLQEQLISLADCIQELQDRIVVIELRQRETLQDQERMRSDEKSGLKKQMEELTAEKDRLLEESFRHVVRLEQISVSLHPPSRSVQLDFLIDKMKEKGDAEAVRRLEEMKLRGDERSRAGLRCILDKVTAAVKQIKRLCSEQQHPDSSSDTSSGGTSA